MDEKKQLVYEPPVEYVYDHSMLVLGSTNQGPLPGGPSEHFKEMKRTGAMFVDGKGGDGDFYRKVFEMARSMETREDFLRINALAGDPESERAQVATEARENELASAPVTAGEVSGGFVSIDGKANEQRGMVFACADLSALSKASQEEAQAILKNCRVKIFMKLEYADPDGAAE